MNGTLYPFIKVGMQKVNLTPTVEIVNGEKVLNPNAPVYIYDTGGPYTDPSIKTDPRQGIERIRKAWITDRCANGQPVGQMACARAGIITPEMEYVSIRENMNAAELGIDTHITPEFVRQEIAEGRAVLPANINHPEIWNFPSSAWVNSAMLPVLEASCESPATVKMIKVIINDGIVVNSKYRMCEKIGLPVTEAAKTVVSDKGETLSPK